MLAADYGGGQAQPVRQDQADSGSAEGVCNGSADGGRRHTRPAPVTLQVCLKSSDKVLTQIFSGSCQK